MELGDFGMGVSLYFSTLRIMTVLFIVLGFINLPTMM